MSTSLVMAISFVVELVLNLAQVLVFASIIVSWVGDAHNPLVQTIRKLTDPLYAPFQGINRKLNLPIDLSPIIVLLIITTLQKGILPAIKMSLLNP
jgi:YggT family protein